MNAPLSFAYPSAFRSDEEFARELDAGDPLRGYRDRFSIPAHDDGRPSLYFASHSLGLQPKSARRMMEEELDKWARRGVEGHFHGESAWYTYQELVRAPAARLVGARPDEVIAMNGLTVNLHLMMTTFYRPSAGRYKILMDAPSFPSDLYAVKSQLRLHGHDPAAALIQVAPRSGEHTLRSEDIEAALDRHGPEIALVLFNLVNFLTGQCLDAQRLAARAREQGCVIGLDLAHAAGNVPVSLHDWQIDFACWCTYKYLNSGPGAVAGCFVHEKHGHNLDLPRLAGWWGNDPDQRFRMQLEPNFVPRAGADGWQVSNPSIFALAPLRASLELFDAAGMPALRAKAECMTRYLDYLLETSGTKRVQLITPRPLAERGCQFSFVVPDRAREMQKYLEQSGVVCDFREPNIIRAAPVPFYNTFHEVFRLSRVLA
jgi:kynureninase